MAEAIELKATVETTPSSAEDDEPCDKELERFINCFFCYKQYSSRAKDDIFSAYSLKFLLQYVNVDYRKIINLAAQDCKASTTRVGVPNDGEVMAPICHACSSLMNKFCRWYRRLETNQQQVNNSLRSIYNRMVEADKARGGRQFVFEKEYPVQSTTLFVMYHMRMDIFEKCEPLLNASPSTSSPVGPARTKPDARNRVKCGECGRLFSRPESFEAHLKIHKLTRQFLDEPVKYLERLRNPNTTSKSMEQIAARLVEAKVVQANSPGWPMKCWFCRHYFESAKVMEKHILQAHIDEVEKQVKKLSVVEDTKDNDNARGDHQSSEDSGNE